MTILKHEYIIKIENVEFYRKGDCVIARDKYLDSLIKSRKNGFPKVITGIRRCGKSYLLKEIYKKYLIDNGVSDDDILMIDLDDDRNSNLRDPIALGEFARTWRSSKEETYIFLDEIQKVYTIINPMLTNGEHKLAGKEDKEVISFVDVVLGLSRETNTDLYVTGSNSKMLSSDIVTEFRDKATNIALSPLSFEEFYNYVGGSKTDAVYEYMQYGGMPMAVLIDEDERKEYLKGLFKTTYFADILEHNKLKKTDSLDELCNIISAGIGSLLNSEKIENTYRSAKKEKITRQTIEKYISYFVDAFMIREAKRYDIKGRAEVGALRKYYYADTGLSNARLNFAYPDEGQLLENIVYNELIYNGYTVNVGAFDTIEKDKNGKSIRKNNEIDFIAVKGIRKYYIQVTANIDDVKTRAREERPFLKLNDAIQKIIVVNKPVSASMDDNGLIIIGVSDFLLNYIK